MSLIGEFHCSLYENAPKPANINAGPRLSGSLQNRTLLPLLRGAALGQTTTDREGDLALIDSFVRRHYRLPGALRLHRHAIGWDLLRAPANVALAPVLLLARVFAILAHVLRLRRLSRFAGRLRPQFRSDVGAVLEADLLSVVLAHRQTQGTVLDTVAVRRLVRDYVTVRNAVSEIGTALVVLLVGIFLFNAVTPGVISLAPVVTEHAAHAREVWPDFRWVNGSEARGTASFPASGHSGILWRSALDWRSRSPSSLPSQAFLPTRSRPGLAFTSVACTAFSGASTALP